jgi:alkylation response protein AidB-like acyl-CoA dehydrogenase
LLRVEASLTARAADGLTPYRPVMSDAWADVEAGVEEIASDWRAARAERQARRHLEADDFSRLRDAGLLRTVVPESMGGLWRSVPETTPRVCALLRTLGRADPSVALVSAMHPAVIGFWVAPAFDHAAWLEQRAAVVESAVEGRQWGTITSEPGSGGDIALTKATAVPDPGATGHVPGASYLVSGDKHFGSGSGVADHMVTTALPQGEAEPAIFIVDTRDRPWDGSSGLTLLAPWDGVGMAATQSHAMRLERCPATRMAWDGPITDVTLAAAPLVANLFTAVVLGVLDEAVETARAQLAAKASGLRAYEQVEWTRAEMDHWLAVQAFEGAIRTVSTGEPGPALHATLRAKQSVAELAETTLGRLARVIGGGTFSRRSPFSAWFEDVRALGFLRPPWGLAYDGLFATSFGERS